MAWASHVGWSHGGGICGQPYGRPRARLTNGLLAISARGGQGAACRLAPGGAAAARSTSPAPPPTAPTQAAARGHTVVRVVHGTRAEGTVPPAVAQRHPRGQGHRQEPGRATARTQRRPGVPARAGSPPGRITPVVAEPGSLAFLADGCADGVIAEDGALSRQLMSEDLAAEIARVLRPGGELLACVDSLVLGMAILAEQHHWAELTDVPHAEVVLVPWPDGTITRCFGAGQLKDLLTEAGLEVAGSGPAPCCPRRWSITCCGRDPGHLPGWSRPNSAPGRTGWRAPARTSRSASACSPPPASPGCPASQPALAARLRHDAPRGRQTISDGGPACPGTRRSGRPRAWRRAVPRESVTRSRRTPRRPRARSARARRSPVAAATARPRESPRSGRSPTAWSPRPPDLAASPNPRVPLAAPLAAPGWTCRSRTHISSRRFRAVAVSTGCSSFLGRGDAQHDSGEPPRVVAAVSEQRERGGTGCRYRSWSGLACPRPAPARDGRRSARCAGLCPSGRQRHARYPRGSGPAA